MSAKPATVDPGALMAQLDLLRQRLAALEVLIAEVEAALRSVETALSTLDAISKGGEILAPGDPGFNLIYRAEVKDADKVIYHVGGQIFALLPRDQAEDKLLRRLEELGKTLAELRREREATASQIAQLEYILQLALAGAQQARRA